jgi:hypothetical protein
MPAHAGAEIPLTALASYWASSFHEAVSLKMVRSSTQMNSRYSKILPLKAVVVDRWRTDMAKRKK